MNFSKGFSLGFISTLVITIVTFLNNIIITRQLGPEGRGKYAILITMVLLFTFLLGEGIRKSNTLLSAKSKENIRILLYKTSIYCLGLLVIFILLYLFRSFWQQLLPNITGLMLIITFITAINVIFWQSIQASFLGLQSIKNFNKLPVVSALMIFSFNAVGIYFFDFKLTEILLTLLISSLIVSLYSLVLIKKEIGNIFSRDYRKNGTKVSTTRIFTRSTISAASFFLTVRGDIFLINFFAGSAQAGLYNIARLFFDILQKFPNIAGPLLISKTVVDDEKVSRLNTARLVRVTFIINIAAVLFLSIFGFNILVFLFKEDFSESFKILTYLMPALLFFGPGSIIYSYFIGKEYPNIVLLLNCIIGFLNIGLNIFFIPEYGVYAAATISSITYFIWTLVLLVYFHKISGIRYSEIIFVKRNDFSYLLTLFRKMFRGRE